MEKEVMYNRICEQLSSLICDEKNVIANLANASSLLYMNLEKLNWVGFYLLSQQELILGPFQGSIACTRIPIGKGVCGKSVERMETIRVDDVHQFPTHIACDSASNSEIVIPIIKENQCLGVLDIDSYVFSRFDEVDQHYLEKFVQILVQHVF